MSGAPSAVPTVVQFGAGAIGRGFLGQLWTEGGYAVVFVDVDPALVDMLNARGSYPLRLVDNDGRRDLTIRPVSAVQGGDRAAVVERLAGCAFACTAVGVPVFEQLAPTLAAAVAERAARGRPPLNLLCCENQNRAGALLRAAVERALPPEDGAARRYFRDAVAFVDASVGRMVPPPTPELRTEDPLLVAAEPYCALPIDGDAWRGPVPAAIPGLLPTRNFAGYVARKLYTHNGGHALLAYQGIGAATRMSGRRPKTRTWPPSCAASGTRPGGAVRRPRLRSGRAAAPRGRPARPVPEPRPRRHHRARRPRSPPQAAP
jgi:mannitol-1-phosphate 5-dehydrogenase